MQNDTALPLPNPLEGVSSAKNLTDTKLSSAITIASLCMIILAELIAAIGATDWALITLLGLPQWTAWILALVSAGAALYGTFYVVRMAIASERNLRLQ